MKTMTVSEFKAHALQVLDQVAKTKEPLLVTKRGKPLAEVVPFRSPDEAPVPGKLAKMLLFEKDIVSPIGGKMWNACK